MKRHTSPVLTALLGLALAGSLPALIQPARADTTSAEKITVLSPLGKPPAIKVLAMAPRPASLKGKTVYVVDDGYVGGDRLLKQIVTWFEQNMPEVKAVYRRKAGGFTTHDAKLWAEIKEKGDAMIMGMGH